MIQLTIREASPTPCRSWTEAHANILDSFDQEGHTSFSLADKGFEWMEEGIHWRTFNAVAATTESIRGYFVSVGRM